LNVRQSPVFFVKPYESIWWEYTSGQSCSELFRKSAGPVACCSVPVLQINRFFQIDAFSRKFSIQVYFIVSQTRIALLRLRLRRGGREVSLSNLTACMPGHGWLQRVRHNTYIVCHCGLVADHHLLVDHPSPWPAHLFRTVILHICRTAALFLVRWKHIKKGLVGVDINRHESCLLYFTCHKGAES
jgi:hypothetical protein